MISSTIFSSSFHKKLQINVQKSYREFIDDLRADFENGFNTDTVSPEFLEQLDDIIHDEALDHYSPTKFYWLNLVDNLIYVIQMHEELLSAEDATDEELEELGETEDELFSFWNESDLAEQFINLMKEDKAVLEASDHLVPLLENQIIAFYVLHVNKYHQQFDDALVYQIVPEIGEGDLGLYLGDQHLFTEFKPKPEGLPALALTSVDFDENEIKVESGNKDLKLKFVKTKPAIKKDDLELFVLPQCLEGQKNHDQFVKNINKALDRIKKYAPHLFTTFKSFTHTIVPVNEEGIVSYSMQSLPGYSSINLFNRDQIDLMDDLLHENGHHYLNTYLNFQELINEDDDKIYYSPWRKALRPVRGIYHATFTFYWALELFVNLNKSTSTEFTKEEKIKIKTRLVEEYLMLEYCSQDLKHAFKNKKINKDGWKLIQDVYTLINSYQKLAATTLNELKSLDKEKHIHLTDLANHLMNMRETYNNK
ncbi:MAG: HEXXH motif-containing putative peptide modification protein [Bacteriovoracaceae bacterium]|nr:HEXXH motif-containing putative peptide modification protein [Bacteriovoracaceae bacterium]